MGLRSFAGSLLRDVRRHVRRVVHRPRPPYRPDLTDAAFIDGLLPVSALLHAATASAAAGDHDAARRQVVEHFLTRSGPKFFCDADGVKALVDKLKREHSEWMAATRERVESDLDHGLQIVSARGMPLRASFDWSTIARGPGNDDLYPAQPHRFGFMPRLALAAHYGVPTRPIVAALLERWMAVARAGHAMCYLSPLVVLYRVLALHWTFTFIASLRSADGCPEDDALLFALLKLLWADCEYLKDQIGHSYPNNHLLADGFAGWYYGFLFPEFTSAAQTRAKGEAIFLCELRRQFLDDGTNFEHSMHYHELGCEMALGYVLLSRRNGVDLPVDIQERIRRMLAFQVAVSGPEAVAMPLGDSTEDPLFPLDATHAWAPGALRECYRALFDPALPPTPAGNLTVERAFWLLGGAMADAGSSPPTRLPDDFPLGGMHVFSDGARSARLICRSGPLEGQPISAGHAHADVLSVYLNVEGLPLIVNSGTYTYRVKSSAWARREPDWRNYFAGPESHNGILAGNDPYGRMSGDFRDRDVPCRVALARQGAVEGLRWLEFTVVRGLAAVGQRRAVIHVEGEYWVVVDLPSSAGDAKDAAIALQFAPGCDLRSDVPGVVEASLGKVRCRVALSSGLDGPRIYAGSYRPLAGWVSPAYGERIPAPQLRVRLADQGQPSAFVLQVPSAASTGVRIAEAVGNDDFIALRIDGGQRVDHLLLRISASDTPMAAWGVEFDGTLVWLRTIDHVASKHLRIGAGRLCFRGAEITSHSS